jgi:fructose-1,6-bisphosphatase/sedoheptulose 1,7-bisphosphatase-like protein
MIHDAVKKIDARYNKNDVVPNRNRITAAAGASNGSQMAGVKLFDDSCNKNAGR